MKIIDRYIFKKFIGTFIYSISLIVLIVIVFDISEKLEDFIGKEATFDEIVFQYYLNFIPYFINLFSPLFTFISVIYFTSKMASHTEIIAILSSGVSFRRMLLPYFLGAAIIAALSLYLNNFVIPHANVGRIEFENKYVRAPFSNRDIHIHRQIEPGTYIYLERYRTHEDLGYKFSLEKMENNQLTYKLMSESIRWDSSINKWSIQNYFIREIKNDRENIRSGIKLDTLLNFSPNDFGRKDYTTETMNYYELNTFIEEEKMKGVASIEIYEIEKYRRFAFPFATFILTFLGVAVASRKVRGGIGMHIGVGILISFSFILFMQVSTTFAASGLASPLIAVWIPNFLFGALLLLLLKYTPK